MYEKTYGNKYDSSLSTVEIAKRIRKDLKAEIKSNPLFAGAKFSVRKDHHNSLVIEVKAMCFNPHNPEKIKDDLEHDYGSCTALYTSKGKEFFDRLDSIGHAYNYDGSDIQSDYFNVNYYLYVFMNSDMSQAFRNAITENLEKEIELYKKAEYEALPDCTQCGEKAHQCYEINGQNGLCWECYYPLFKIEDDKKQAAFEAEQKAHNKLLEKIEVVDLVETHEFTEVVLPNLNKNCTIEEYNEERAKGDYTIVRALITEKATLTTEQYDIFSECLLDNLPWLAGKGGCNSTTDIPGTENLSYFDLTPEQQEQWKVGLYTIFVEVSAPNRETVYIDPQGYSYARYLGFAVSKPKPTKTKKNNIVSLVDFKNKKRAVH